MKVDLILGSIGFTSNIVCDKVHLSTCVEMFLEKSYLAIYWDIALDSNKCILVLLLI